MLRFNYRAHSLTTNLRKATFTTYFKVPHFFFMLFHFTSISKKKIKNEQLPSDDPYIYSITLIDVNVFYGDSA